MGVIMNIFEKYRNKINKMSYRQRGGMYLLFFTVSYLVYILAIDDRSHEIIGAIAVISFPFFGYKTLTNIIEAEKTTEFIQDGKLYNIKKSTLLYRVDHKYFYDRFSDVEEYRRYSILYKSEKGTYFLYIMTRNFKILIEPFKSEKDAKNWLIYIDRTRYEEVFGAIEEA